jgi:hypothetical protein
MNEEPIRMVRGDRLAQLLQRFILGLFSAVVI